ncbi:MAG: hypothetical protein AB7I30_05835 [Isosphaeraceae bacterium]
MSRPRSAPASKASRASRPTGGGARGVYVQAPKSDVYVVLLGVAFGAMLIGCLLLLLIWNRYGFSTKATASRPSTPASIALANGEFGKIGTVRL